MCKTVWKENNISSQNIPPNNTSNNFTQNDIIYINAPPQGVGSGRTDSLLRNIMSRLNNLREDDQITPQSDI